MNRKAADAADALGRVAVLQEGIAVDLSRLAADFRRCAVENEGRRWRWAARVDDPACPLGRTSAESVPAATTIAVLDRIQRDLDALVAAHTEYTTAASAALETP